jgi:hypothetical protein
MHKGRVLNSTLPLAFLAFLALKESNVWPLDTSADHGMGRKEAFLTWSVFASSLFPERRLYFPSSWERYLIFSIWRLYILVSGDPVKN